MTMSTLRRGRARWAPGLLAIAVIASCSSDSAAPDPAKVAQLILSLTTTQFASLNDSVDITVQARNEDGGVVADPQVSWTTQNAAVARVDRVSATAGRITSVGDGLTIVRATAGTVTAEIAVSVAQTASQVVFAVAPGNGYERQPFTTPIAVEVRDARGNAVKSFNGAVQLAMATTANNATLRGTLQVNAVQGRATFPGVSLSTWGRGLTLRATALNLTTTSAPFSMIQPMVFVGGGPAAAGRVYAIFRPDSIVGGKVVGADPIGVLATGDGFGYVANQGSGTVQVFDSQTSGDVAPAMNVGPLPTFMALSDDGARVYVTISTGISVIQHSSRTVVATWTVPGNPRNLVVSPDGSRLYVVTAGGVVRALNTTTGVEVANVSTGSLFFWLAITPNGQNLILPRVTVDSVSVYSASTLTRVASIATPGGPSGTWVTPNGAFAYVAMFLAAKVIKIDLNTRQVVKEIPVGPGPAPLVGSPDGAYIYVVNQQNGSVSIIRTSDDTVIRTISALNAYGHLAVTPLPR